MSTSTWPSADLWTRLANGTIADETPCPACRCPFATHYRDAKGGVLLCPPGGDPVKLAEMVKRAPRVPATISDARPPTPAFGTSFDRGWLANIAGVTPEEILIALRQNSDLQTLYPDIMRIYASVAYAEPPMTLERAIPMARAAYLERLEEQAEERKRTEAASRIRNIDSVLKEVYADAIDELAKPDIVFQTFIGRNTKTEQQEPPAAVEPPAPAGNRTRRRFNMEDE